MQSYTRRSDFSWQRAECSDLREASSKDHLAIPPHLKASWKPHHSRGFSHRGIHGHQLDRIGVQVDDGAIFAAVQNSLRASFRIPLLLFRLRSDDNGDWCKPHLSTKRTICPRSAYRTDSKPATAARSRADEDGSHRDDREAQSCQTSPTIRPEREERLQNLPPKTRALRPSSTAMFLVQELFSALHI
jgi:hypothetical protein